MKFPWSKEYETRIPALDAQHRSIFEAINRFFAACDKDGGTDDLLPLFDALDTYVREHFSYEEKLQQINEYPGLAEQQAQHALFLDDLAELKASLAATGPTRELSLLVKGKLFRWFINHIKGLDRQFVLYLQERQSV